MRSLGYDPGDLSTDTSTPTGIGNVAARAVLDFRHRDGANQLGDEPGGIPGVPYSDYTRLHTGERPDGHPRSRFDPATVHDPSSWQPLRYVDGSGIGRDAGVRRRPMAARDPVRRHAPDRCAQPTGPARYGSAEYRAQAQALLDLSAGLTDEQKMIAEYWADGPRSELPPGTGTCSRSSSSRRDHHGDHEHGLERDVKLFFALTNAVSDAGCCAWDNKRAFDSVRPITAIRTLFRGRTVRAWAGPYQGTKLIDGAAWFPYQPTTFPTPPFPEYSSGHSNFSAAGAEILKLFTHSDRFGASVTLPAGSSRVEPGAVPATTSRSPGRPSRRRPTRPASRAATAASTSSRATSTLAPPGGSLLGSPGSGPGTTGKEADPE